MKTENKTSDMLAYKKQYYNDHKDIYEQYYQKNKEKIKSRINNKVVCPVCEKLILEREENRHINTKIHQRKMLQLLQAIII